MIIRSLKRVLAGILAAIMVIPFLPEIPIKVKAQENSFLFEYDDFTIEYTIRNEWSNNQDVEIKIHNNVISYKNI